MKFSTALLCAALVAVAFSQCGNNVSQTLCDQANGCAWSATSATTCQAQATCSSISTQLDCTSTKYSSICNWNAPTADMCTVKTSACTLQEDGKTCSNPNSCGFQAATQATCTPSSNNFGCSKNTSEASCTNQCTWLTAFCQSAGQCEKQSPDTCDATNCTLTATSCKVNANANVTCPTYTTEATCTANGCAFANNACAAPANCAPTNGKCPTVCTATTGNCDTPSTSCTSATQDGCTANFCTWNTAQPKCIDNSNYCTVANCANQGPYCTSNAATAATCTPNSGNVGCTGLSNADCTSAANQNLCQFTFGAEGNCSNQIANCGAYTNEQYCGAQTPCKWSNVYECSASTTPTPSPSSNAKVMIASVVATLVALLL